MRAPYCGSTALCNDAEIFHGFFALIGGLCNMLIFNHQSVEKVIDITFDRLHCASRVQVIATRDFFLNTVDDMELNFKFPY